MEALKFRLSGNTAFFKKPDVNTYYYFTYQTIHKISVFGILGAVIGLKGYQFQEDNKYPEFYEKLKNIKIAIKPISDNGVFNKKMQTFNNSVGYASKEKGGNLIVKEQWLEKPKWDIYIKGDESVYYKKIKEYLLNNKCEYMPYLGKNDHPARISNFEVIEELNEIKEYSKIHTLFKSDKFEFKVAKVDMSGDNEEFKWKYKEKLPLALNEEINQYELESFTLTNNEVLKSKDEKVYSYNNENICFF